MIWCLDCMLNSLITVIKWSLYLLRWAAVGRSLARRRPEKFPLVLVYGGEEGLRSWAMVVMGDLEYFVFRGGVRESCCLLEYGVVRKPYDRS